MLLIRWPKQLWTPDFDAVVDMTAAERAIVARLSEGGRRVLTCFRETGPPNLGKVS
ncbi:hypothetical protein [Limimaricola cinnabarinus]|uniref:hypothetical protein n=1 Tax=Limimaricola cinnabarinus TaxID=1125964 RepID=UPI00249156DF|nr:hypothetical protein [Limimaricola cinnabarinus]